VPRSCPRRKLLPESFFQVVVAGISNMQIQVHNLSPRCEYRGARRKTSTMPSAGGKSGHIGPAEWVRAAAMDRLGSPSIYGRGRMQNPHQIMSLRTVLLLRDYLRRVPARLDKVFRPLLTSGSFPVPYPSEVLCFISLSLSLSLALALPLISRSFTLFFSAR